MNLEEAIANIEKEVIFKDSMFENCDVDFIDILKSASKIIISNVDKTNVIIKLFNKFNEMFVWCFVNPKHLKLKEQPMQNYKIRVTPETSEEVQRLFFELNYAWSGGNKTTKYKDSLYIHTIDKIITVTNCEETYSDLNATEITPQQLRDLVVLKRNDVSDSTHEHIESGNKYYRGFKDYVFDGVGWVLTDITFPNSLKPINREMTWQDALRAVADGKDVERFKDGEWQNINDAFKYSRYRLKPKTIQLNGEHTKEEWLKILGEME